MRCWTLVQDGRLINRYSFILMKINGYLLVPWHSIYLEWREKKKGVSHVTWMPINLLRHNVHNYCLVFGHITDLLKLCSFNLPVQIQKLEFTLLNVNRLSNGTRCPKVIVTSTAILNREWKMTRTPLHIHNANCRKKRNKMSIARTENVQIPVKQFKVKKFPSSNFQESTMTVW